MSDPSAPVRHAREISDFLALMGQRLRRPLSEPVDPAEEVEFFERKAALFTRLAAACPDDALRQDVAANARAQLTEVLKQHGLPAGGEH